jgi:hypothetical protein
MENNTADSEVIVACCGLVCSKCGAFTKGKCTGCHGEKPMFKSCPVKKCVKEHDWQTCGQCSTVSDFKKCKKLYNPISRLFGFIFRSNRLGNLEAIRHDGLDEFWKRMRLK